MDFVAEVWTHGEAFGEQPGRVVWEGIRLLEWRKGLG